MFVACNHRNGLNCNGVIVAGPAPPLPPSSSPEIPRPKMHGAYAITETDDPRFEAWARTMSGSSLVASGVIVWAESEPALQLALFEGRRSGRFASPTDWATATKSVPASS